MQRPRRGFTLIEVLVVVTIILMVAGILLAIGAGARTSAKRRSTLATLKLLDACMQDYLKTHPEPLLPSPWPLVYTSSNKPAYDNLTITGPASTCGSDLTNWVARLMADNEIAPRLGNLPMGKDIQNPPSNVILDAWGAPIRHIPSGATNAGSLVPISIGYFLSAGPDGRFRNSTNAAAGWPQDDIVSTDPE